MCVCVCVCKFTFSIRVVYWGKVVESGRDTEGESPLNISTSSADILRYEAKSLGHGQLAARKATSAPSMTVSTWLASRSINESSNSQAMAFGPYWRILLEIVSEFSAWYNVGPGLLTMTGSRLGPIGGLHSGIKAACTDQTSLGLES